MSELIFEPEAHSYKSIDDPDRVWTSVTTMLKYFHEEFDQETIAARCSKKPSSKWYGIPPEKIIEIWNAEADRANECGTWYHDAREEETVSCNTIRREGLDLEIHGPIKDGVCRISPNQQLIEGIYPEHFVYLKSANVCGQADRVEVVGDRVDVYDYKTNKEIKETSYVNWQGQSKKMFAPIQHLDDCNLIHYTLQLSIYMYIILKHNHHLKPGKIMIQHVTFKWAGTDEFGFPILERDQDDNPIIDKLTPYELPYLKKEVTNMFKHLKTHPKLMTK